jgi:hypothetical protein
MAIYHHSRRLTGKHAQKTPVFLSKFGEKDLTEQL